MKLVWIAIGIILCFVFQKLSVWLDKQLDGFQGIVFLPEERAKELEQYLWGQG